MRISLATACQDPPLPNQPDAPPPYYLHTSSSSSSSTTTTSTSAGVAGKEASMLPVMPEHGRLRLCQGPCCLGRDREFG
jgi:hypothetical protein